MTKNIKLNRQAQIEWVPLVKMRINEFSQRELREFRINRMVSEFDDELLGLPTVSSRDGYYYIIDGQHRIEAYKRWLGEGWEGQMLQCQVYYNLTEAEEADLFDRLNDVLRVDAYDKFRIRCNAGRPDEVRVAQVVESVGLKFSKHSKKSSPAAGIRAVTTLMKVYKRSNADTLERTLRIIAEAYGTAALDAKFIDGIGHVVQRYGGVLDDAKAIEKLASVRGGYTGILTRAGLLREQTGAPEAQCIAAAAVDAINKGKRGDKKLASWWHQS